MQNDQSLLKQYVIDFVEGRVEARDLMLRFLNNPALPTWLQSIAPESMTSCIVVPDESRWGGLGNAWVPYDIYLEVGKSVQPPHRLGEQLNVHDAISRLPLAAFPDEEIKVSTKIEKKFLFLLDNCPRSVGGPESDPYIEKLLDEIPADLPNKTRAQMFRARIKEEFHLDGKHYPYWCQEAEWPMHNGKPMRYVSQLRRGEMRFYLFEDVETGEECVIFQSY